MVTLEQLQELGDGGGRRGQREKGGWQRDTAVWSLTPPAGKDGKAWDCSAVLVNCMSPLLQLRLFIS